jgi:hypothetical protein
VREVRSNRTAALDVRRMVAEDVTMIRDLQVRLLEVRPPPAFPARQPASARTSHPRLCIACSDLARSDRPRDGCARPLRAMDHPLRVSSVRRGFVRGID